MVQILQTKLHSTLARDLRVYRQLLAKMDYAIGKRSKDSLDLLWPIVTPTFALTTRNRRPNLSASLLVTFMKGLVVRLVYLLNEKN